MGRFENKISNTKKGWTFLYIFIKMMIYLFPSIFLVHTSCPLLKFSVCAFFLKSRCVLFVFFFISLWMTFCQLVADAFLWKICVQIHTFSW